jgi:glucose/arabinose dehydrogenase
LFAADGGVFTYGDAGFFGSAGGLPLVQPIVGGAPTPSGRGYWLFAADGGVFTYGDAGFFGSAGGLPLVQPVVGGTSSPTGQGYWLVAADGGVFTYGDAGFHGSAAALPLVAPIIGIDATASGRGYRMFAADGGEFDFGDARFVASIAARGVRFSAFAVMSNDRGHWLVTAGGQLQQSGLAPRLGSPRAGPPTAPPPGTPPPFPPAPPPPSPGPQPPIAQVPVRLAPLGTFDQPMAIHTRAGDPAGVLYIAQRPGQIIRLDRATGGRSTVVDIDPLTQAEGERGLLGFDFSPTGHQLYLVHTNNDGNVQVAEYQMSGNAAGSRRLLLQIDQPFPNHNGGDLHVTPDGRLWITSGDGGSGGDPQNNGQDTTDLLGAILRIDPRPGGGLAYSIPPDNPFASRQGFRGEIWDYGLRNPWRMSFDPVTGDLWIGDVGQGSREEIDFEPPGSGGRNYGWKRFEGNSLFDAGTAAPNAVGPIHEYTHGEGCSVTGGVVYRGAAIPGLRGTYLFADYCSGRIWGLRQSSGRATEVAQLRVNASEIVAFGIDDRNEVYLASLGGTVHQLLPG